LTQPVFRAVAATHTPEILAALTLLIVALAAMASERAGLSLAFGALLAGMMLASSPYRLQVAAEVGPFRGLLLGLFFMSVGMALDVQVLRQYFGAILAVSFALMAGKSLVTGALAWALHFPPGQAVRFGLLLSQGGEFAFVLFGVGARDQIIPEPHVQVLSAAVIVSMMATPLIALAGRRLERAIAGRGTSAVPQMAADAEQISDHVIIAGYGRIGRAVSRQLGEQGISWIAIDSDAGIVLEAQAKDLPVYYGDAWHLDVMVALHVERARSVVVTVNNPPAALQLVAALHYAIPGMTIIARAYDEAHAEELRHAGATAVIPEAAPVGSRLAALATASPG
jgi:CPA2 family monovalent cation:H+ antiporter-2